MVFSYFSIFCLCLLFAFVAVMNNSRAEVLRELVSHCQKEKLKLARAECDFFSKYKKQVALLESEVTPVVEQEVVAVEPLVASVEAAQAISMEEEEEVAPEEEVASPSVLPCVPSVSALTSASFFNSYCSFYFDFYCCLYFCNFL